MNNSLDKEGEEKGDELLFCSKIILMEEWTELTERRTKSLQVFSALLYKRKNADGMMEGVKTNVFHGTWVRKG